jgi:hypothetical protein
MTAFNPATHRRLRKYQIRHAPKGWWARVPYGSWRWFETWDLAVLWLRVRHEERTIEAEKKARRESAESA